MRIALYYPWVYLCSAVEKNIIEIKRRSRHDWNIFTSHFDQKATYPELGRMKITELKKIPVNRSYLSVLKAAITITFQKIDLSQYDVLWVHNEGLGNLIALRNHQKPLICFCHTPLKVLHDPFMRKTYLSRNRMKVLPFLTFGTLFNILDRLSWKYYKHVFCVSREVKNRITKANLFPEDKVSVIYRGVDTERLRPNWNYGRYFIQPVRIKWWKNIELSVESFKHFAVSYRGIKNFKLIIAGQVDEGSREYHRKLVSLSKDNKDIIIIANPSQEQFHCLMRNCHAALFTTLNEDWGTTMLEMMSYGKAIIAVNSGGPTEIVRHGETGYLTSPNPESFSKAMITLASDKELNLAFGRKARERSKIYEWDNFINMIDGYLDNLQKDRDLSLPSFV